MVQKNRSISNILESALVNLIPNKRSIGFIGSQNFGLGYFGSTGATTKSGTLVTSNTSLTLSAFFNGIILIGNDIAKLSKGVYSNIDNTIKHEKAHHINNIIAVRPNQYQTSFSFYTTMITIAILKGNFYGYIEADEFTGKTKKIIIWDPDQVDVIHYNKKLWYKYKNEIYPSEVIIHIPGVFSFDGISGVPVIKLAAQSLGVALSAQEYSAEYYASKGVGAGYVSSEKELDPTAKKKISSAVSEVLTSITPWKIPVFDEGMQFKQLKITAEESQFLLTSKHGIAEVARWLNLPVHKLKQLDQATNNNIEHQSLEHVSDSIHPWAAKIEQEFNSKLFTEKEKRTHYIKFNLRSLLRADLKNQADYYAKGINFGWMLPNEVRALEEMNPIPGGDDMRWPANLMTLEQINNTLKDG